MFANISNVLNICCLHDSGYSPCEGEVVVDSSNFLFGDKKWERYFVTPPMLRERKQGVIYTTPPIRFAIINGPVTPRLPICSNKQIDEIKNIPTECILLPPHNPHAIHNIYKDQIKFQPYIADRICRESKEYNIDRCLGLHIRGPLRLHGGVAEMKAKLGIDRESVPYELYFRKVDELLHSDLFANLFVFSDSLNVIKRVRKRYGSRVINREDNLLTLVGEPHLMQNEKYMEAVGLDIVIEANLMSNVKYLVHGNSNITNCVQIINPKLSHYDIYQEFYK